MEARGRFRKEQCQDALPDRRTAQDKLGSRGVLKHEYDRTQEWNNRSLIWNTRSQAWEQAYSDLRSGQ